VKAPIELHTSRENHTVFYIVLVLMVGCSKWGDPVAGTKGSGDLVAFVLQCATGRGGLPATNDLPTIQAEWTVKANLVEDVIFVPGDHYDEIQAFLTRAFGELDRSKGSFTVTTNSSGIRSGFYHLQQAGLGLQFTGDSKQTVICILGPAKP
jgi:hypothetical protein